MLGRRAIPRPAATMPRRAAPVARGVGDPRLGEGRPGGEDRLLVARRLTDDRRLVAELELHVGITADAYEALRESPDAAVRAVNAATGGTRKDTDIMTTWFITGASRGMGAS